MKEQWKLRYNIAYFVSFLKNINSFLYLVVDCCCLVAKSCLTLCEPMACSPSGSSGISQARILERVTIPSQEDLPCQGIKLVSPELGGRFFTNEPPGKPYVCVCVCVCVCVHAHTHAYI